MSFPHIVVGTYEEFVLGYNPQFKNEKAIKCKLQQTFATHSHQASVRCVAAHDRLMASSGADEYINIYDMVEMEVSTVINYHNSTVTCLEFTPDGSHLVTANQMGDIAIFRCRDWTLVKLWKEAHKHANGVTSMSIHPSGSLLLTTGADNVIRFWNLVKGRQAYATNFSKKTSVGNSLNFGKWSKNGIYYAACIGNKLEIYKTETAALVYEIKTNSRIISSTFTKKNLICIAAEDGSLEIHSIKEKKLLLKKEAHKIRVKSLSSFELKIFKNNKDLIKSYIVSVDSNGGIKLWQFKKNGMNYSLLLRAEADCGCRITCLTVVASVNVKKEEDDVPGIVNNEINQETSAFPKCSKNQITSDDNDKKAPSLKTKNLKRKIDSSNPFVNGKTTANKNGVYSEQNLNVKNSQQKLGENKKDFEKVKRMKKFNKKKIPDREIRKKRMISRD